MYYYNENNEINLDSAVLFKLHNVLLVPCSLLKFKLHNVLLQSEACVYDIDYEDPFKLHNVLLQSLIFTASDSNSSI